MIKFAEPIEVSKDKYNLLMDKYSGIIAGRESEGKFYIKVWLMQYASMIERDLK